MSNMDKVPRRRRLTADEYVEGVLSNNRAILAQTITLIESHAPKYAELGQEVITKLLSYTGNSIRVGITGVPGSGKSTLIESLGSMLCEQGHHVAVLAVDPSSRVSHGSILGDKTRMEQLSRNPNAYVRPSPTGGTLGGVSRKSRESILICEAAGYDVIIVETVGVGQSEVAVRSMVDFFLVIMLTGAGDELQGLKKGILELADAIFINKADGDNKHKSLAVKEEMNRVLHFLRPATEGWSTDAFTCSAITGEGISIIWEVLRKYRETTKKSGVFDIRRQQQILNWMEDMIEEQLKNHFYHHKVVKEALPTIQDSVVKGDISPAHAVQKLLYLYNG